MEQRTSWDDVEVLIVGPGLMGSNIAQAYAQNGIRVGLIGRSEASLERSRALIDRELGEAVAKGIFAQPQVEEISRRILPGLALEDGSRGKNLQLVIEAVSEDLALKKELLARLDELCPPAVVLATSTSCLDAEVLAVALRRPERLVWMHFFFPAHKNRAAELAPLHHTLKESLACATRLFKAARKDPVCLLRYRKGGAANVIFVGLLLEAARLMEEGFSFAGVEQASRQAFSIPVGFASFLSLVGPKLATSCLASFSDASRPDHPFHRVYDNFFSPPKAGPVQAGMTTGVPDVPPVQEKSADAMALDYLKRRFLAVAFMTATEVVEAGIVLPPDVDRLCRTAFGWPQGPFGLMNRIGVGESLRMVTEKMELSHRHEINFPVPRLLIEKAQSNEPWPGVEGLPS